MHAMQYEMTLPADYDMHAFRERIGGVRHVYDDLPGLALKAYLFRERGVDSSPVNQYSLFYLWNDPEAMAHFLAGGGGFERIIAFAGRLPVLHWAALSAIAGPARATPPRAASRRLIELPPDVDVVSRIKWETEHLAALAQCDGVHTAVLVLDPARWRLLRFVLWADRVPRDEGATERFDVLHVSTPGLASLLSSAG